MSDPPGSLSCPICQDLFKNVVETPCCSTGYCLECLDVALKKSGTCPSCRKKISIFDCKPNRMVQRMVDDYPAECIYPGCTAKITMGIRKEHIEKCDRKPRPIGGDVALCSTHNMPLIFECLEDRNPVCGLCFLVGKHRTHRIDMNLQNKSSSFRKGVRNVAAVALQTNQPANYITLPYIIADSISDINVLEKVISGDVKIDSNSNSNTGKEESKSPTPIERERKMICVAAYLCHLQNEPIHSKNITKYLRAAGHDGEALIEPDFLTLFDTYKTKVTEWFQGSESEEEKLKKLVSANIDEKKAQKEFEELKEKYHNEQFNFQGIQIKAVPLCSHILPKVANHVYVLLEIKVGKKVVKKEEKRPPFALSIVLDRSGSMGTDKMQTANNAVIEVIDKLDKEDVLHIVTFESEIAVVYENGTYKDKEKMKEAVSKITALGGTHMSGGLQMGYDVVKRTKAKIPTQKIFLFSDGCAGPGIVYKPEMFAFVDKLYGGGVGISAFGIGMDFDEQMMKGIADHGKGHYFFIDKLENFSGQLDKAFKGLSRTVGINVVLKAKGTKGRVVTKIKESTSSENEDLFKGVPLGDLREKDLKQVLLQIEVNEDASVNPLDILEFELSYERLDDCIPASPQTGSVKVKTTDNDDLLSTFNDDPLVYLTIHECSEMDKRILKHLDKNDLEGAIALKQEIINALKSVADKDKVGFVKVLLLKAQRGLNDLIANYHSRRASYSSSYSYGSAASGSAKSMTQLKKEAHKAATEAEDEDMGFGLFD